MGTHIESFLQNQWINVTLLGGDKVLMVPYKCCSISAKSAQGWSQGRPTR